MEHASPAVNVENARVYLGGHEILHNISWQVQRGERCFILGANGAGKTTLVKVLMGFAWPLFGARVQVLGKTFGHVNLLELRKSIAWVSPFMHKWLEDGSWNGRDMVLSGPDGTIGLLREPTPEEEEKAAGIMKSLKAEHLMDRPVVAMSSGEQVKVLIARALMTNPELMILDEPSVYLDLAGREFLLKTIEELAQRRPFSVLINWISSPKASFRFSSVSTSSRLPCATISPDFKIMPRLNTGRISSMRWVINTMVRSGLVSASSSIVFNKNSRPAKSR